jgi:RES domain
MFRVYDGCRLPNEFNTSGRSGRFRPIVAEGGVTVPTLYCSNCLNGALGESVFHDLPTGPTPRVIPRAALLGWVRTVLVPKRALRLVDLTGWAHKALGLDSRGLIECDAAEYPTTALWAKRLHDTADAPDGLYWRSRQYDRACAVMLFGDRVAPGDLHVVLDETLPLWEGMGLVEVLSTAAAANITITPA